MKRANGMALILLGAVAFYILGRWGGSGESRNLLPLLGSSPGLPIIALGVGLLLLIGGMILLALSHPTPELQQAPLPWTTLQILPLISGSVALVCLAAVALGASRGWQPRTLAAVAALGIVQALVGAILTPFWMGLPGRRSITVVSVGMIWIGAAWAASLLVLGLSGA
ncbi:MAG: hypothetical protein O6952_06575 [Planctomycetota bacterium]|nr:hypothetical protein [Planctomycetota bacterium]